MGRWLLALVLFGCGGLSADAGLLCELDGKFLIEATSDTCEPLTTVKEFHSQLGAFCGLSFGPTSEGYTGHLRCNHDEDNPECDGTMTGNGCTYQVTARACGRDLPLSCSPADATPQPASPGEQEALCTPDTSLVAWQSNGLTHISRRVNGQIIVRHYDETPPFRTAFGDSEVSVNEALEVCVY